MDITNKKAFVTGGSGDIGRAISLALAREGVDVAISYVGHREAADHTLAAIEKIGCKGIAVQMDQRDPSSINQAVNEVINYHGRLDILVNNAGWNIGIPFSDLEKLNEEIWDRVMETNLKGPFLLSRAFAEYLKAGNPGRIVNIASVAGIVPGGSSIAYASSKSGLIHLTRCLAVALAPDVTVNCIAPGLVEDTRMATNVPEKQVNAARRQAVLRRVASIDDIAEQTILFCQTESITGQLMVVDGGMPGCMR